jgi:glycosyltransferase involved in cell wall biosynthesis
MTDFYSMTEICDIPSLWEEPFGLVAIEALAAEKPVIVSDKGGVIDIVQNEVNCIIEPSGSIPDFVNRLEFLCVSPLFRTSLGQKDQKK